MRAMFALLTVTVSIVTANVKGAEKNPNIDEARAQTRQLAEFMRQDIESNAIIDAGVVEVNLIDYNRTPNSSATGIVVPFSVEGRGGGNLFQTYVALYKVKKIDKELLSGMNAPKTAYRRVAFIAMLQVDGRRWRYVDWSNYSIDTGTLKVPACEDAITLDKCPPDRVGTINIAFDGNTFGPNLKMTNDPP